jgi:hypothetical protein
MSNITYNIILLTVCWAVVTGTGVYITYFVQPKELERLEKAEKVAKMKQMEFASLLAQEATTRQKAEEVLQRWHARYKLIPDTLDSPEVVGYFNSLTRNGFENFDVTFKEIRHSNDFDTFVYHAQGRAYFNSLYRFIWSLENNRNFYRVNSLVLNQIDLLETDQATGKDRLQMMVSFDLTIDAYFGGSNGLSAGDQQPGGMDQPLLAMPGNLPPVPGSTLPSRNPAMNPFYPLIFDDLPPNTDGLVNIEQAQLVSIVGGKAVFQEQDQYRKLGVGDAVYLGQITMIDPEQGRVVVRLNKGGIVDEVELRLQTGERYRQALGSTRLSPIEN